MKKWWRIKEKDSEEKAKRIAIFSDFYRTLDINRDVPTTGIFRPFSEYGTLPRGEGGVVQDSYPIWRHNRSSDDTGTPPVMRSKSVPAETGLGVSRQSILDKLSAIQEIGVARISDTPNPKTKTPLEDLTVRDRGGSLIERQISNDSAPESRPISAISLGQIIMLPSVAGMALPEPEFIDGSATNGDGEQQQEDTEGVETDSMGSLEERMGIRGRGGGEGESGTENSILSAATLQVSSGAGFDWTLAGTPEGDAAGAQATVTTMESTATLISNSSKTKSKFQCYFSWTQNTDAYLVAISLAFGLGNLLRLPRIVALNGGGLFMIVYICITLLFGIPLIFLEIGLGQFCQQGTTKIWHAVPLFKGVGLVKVIASFLMSIYYPMLMTIALFYFVWSAKGPIPFDDCPRNEDDLVTQVMVAAGQGEECLRSTILTPNQSDGPWFAVYIAFIFLIWCIFCLCLFKSVSSYRLSIYILILPTIACLIAVLVNATNRENASKGIDMLTTIDWNNLLNAEVWYFATIQMFFSTHAGLGNIVTCAGKMYSKTNAFLIAVSYVVINLITGIIFVITVYLWIGETYEGNSIQLTTAIPEIFVLNLIYDASVKSADSLTRLWSSLAFLTLLLAGFISMVALLFSSILALVQESERKIKWWHIVMAICGVGFSLGVLFILQPDIEILHMLDHYVIGRMVLASTVLELIGFSWIYGGDTLYKDFEFVLGQKLNVLWRYIWIITPVFLLIMELLSLVKIPLDGLGNIEDHEWTYAVGWSLYLTTWFIVIISGIQQINKQVDYNFTDKFLSSLKPSIDWGPVDPICRHRWKQWGDQYSLTGRRDFTLSRRGTRDYTHSVRANSSPVIITQNATDTSPPTTSSENDMDNNSGEPFSINVQNGLIDNASNGPFTLQANPIGGRQMPKGRHWRAMMMMS